MTKLEKTLDDFKQLITEILISGNYEIIEFNDFNAIIKNGDIQIALWTAGGEKFFRIDSIKSGVSLFNIFSKSERKKAWKVYKIKSDDMRDKIRNDKIKELKHRLKQLEK